MTPQMEGKSTCAMDHQPGAAREATSYGSLCRLPLEVRRLIYGHLDLGGKFIAIQPSTAYDITLPLREPPAILCTSQAIRAEAEEVQLVSDVDLAKVQNFKIEIAILGNARGNPVINSNAISQDWNTLVRPTIDQIKDGRSCTINLSLRSHDFSSVHLKLIYGTFLLQKAKQLTNFTSVRLPLEFDGFYGPPIQTPQGQRPVHKAICQYIFDSMVSEMESILETKHACEFIGSSIVTFQFRGTIELKPEPANKTQPHTAANRLAAWNKLATNLESLLIQLPNSYDSWAFQHEPFYDHKYLEALAIDALGEEARRNFKHIEEMRIGLHDFDLGPDHGGMRT
ncbi:uncharacterized protein KY384_003504 [Bacidia gigantensis]|uniref:uncharacterized protein n=1 Tax=Bacidia gigantensis TaxID=2732470 RepID=UPI001D04C2D7|nr:uncharacterized protein KY384_003504 [Bacidia gigantensis]KAG8531868.1 hypothetical protein KY384_003504 [Bacidia gigantensis]